MATVVIVIVLVELQDPVMEARDAPVGTDPGAGAGAPELGAAASAKLATRDPRTSKAKLVEDEVQNIIMSVQATLWDVLADRFDSLTRARSKTENYNRTNQLQSRH